MTRSTQTLPAVGSGAMFDTIAHRYDVLNRVLSLGIDQRWRRKTANAIAPPQGGRVLDLATGTGDLAIQVAQQHEVSVVGLDPAESMLRLAAAKTKAQALHTRISLVSGDAQTLPFSEDSFDACTMAFGIRNVPDRRTALREMQRVLRPGGQLAILELSEPRSGWIAPLARFHIHYVVPWIGAALSGKREYAYLQKSIAAFPPPDEFCAMMEEAGFEAASSTPLTFGACTLFTATVPACAAKVPPQDGALQNGALQ